MRRRGEMKRKGEATSLNAAYEVGSVMVGKL